MKDKIIVRENLNSETVSFYGKGSRLAGRTELVGGPGGRGHENRTRLQFTRERGSKVMQNVGEVQIFLDKLLFRRYRSAFIGLLVTLHRVRAGAPSLTSVTVTAPGRWSPSPLRPPSPPLITSPGPAACSRGPPPGRAPCTSPLTLNGTLSSR